MHKPDIISRMQWLKTFYYSTTQFGFPPPGFNAAKVLNESEQARYQRYKFDHSRWAFALGRWISKTQLAELLERDVSRMEFGYMESGKPFLVDSDELFFNISHTDSAVVVAISNKAIGIDIELHKRRGDPWQKAQYFLNQSAAEHLKKLPLAQQELGFARYWTCMEARVKADGATLYAVKESFALQGLVFDNEGKASDDGLHYATYPTDQAEQIAYASRLPITEAQHYLFDGQRFVLTPG